MSDWNPALYLKFKKERTQPVHDLISRIELSGPSKILDIGCGPGNSTAALKLRFPQAEVTGIDFSQSMIERAKTDCPNCNFLVCDASGDLSELLKFDLVFANASLQWLPHHDSLLRRYFGMLNPGGAIAMQIPQFDIMPVSRIIDNVAALPDFIGFFENFETGMHYYPTGYYYETLSNLTANLEIWITGYLHQMQNHTAIIEWLSSTGLKPYIERLPKEFQPYFLSKVLDGIKNQYPAQKNGRVLFEFKRLFFIAYKP